MQIDIVDFVAGAQSARGLAVVIDVFRAFSVGCYAFAGGAAAIHPFADIEAARRLKLQHPDWLLIGERFGKRLPGFEYGNSPTDIEHLELQGRTLIQTTHSGTQGLANASLADEVITGALVNAGAIVRYAQLRSFEQVTLVRMGQAASARCVEDDLCAEVIAARLRGEPFDIGTIRPRLRAAPSADKFFDPACDWAPEGDFERCAAVDKFDFVLHLEREESPARLRRIDVPR
jgi:2-phosphosulfolactate phosphatase